MGDLAKVEARIVVPSGGWGFDVDATEVTVPAGEYYQSTAGDGARGFLAEVETQIQTQVASAAVALGADGRVTISASSSFSITWTDTQVRDLLGFTGNLSGSSSYTGSQQAAALWLPGEWQALAGGAWEGWDETDFSATEAPTGRVVSAYGNRKVANQITFPAVPRAKTWQVEEDIGQESFQRFFRDWILGEHEAGRPGGPLRWYPDADDDATYVTYRWAQGSDFRPDHFSQQWSGYYTIQFPRLVKV